MEDRLRIAVFIDFDNIEIGVKNTLGRDFEVSPVLEALKERGDVLTKIAYADWTRQGTLSRTALRSAAGCGLFSPPPTPAATGKSSTPAASATRVIAWLP